MKHEIKIAPFARSHGWGVKNIPTHLFLVLNGSDAAKCGVSFVTVGNELLPVRETTRVVVYRLDTHQKPLFLLLFNGKHKYWQNPQGGIDPGEDYKQAGSREVQEETGLETVDFVDNSHVVVQYRSMRKGRVQRSVVHGLAACTNKTHIILNEEDGHTEYGRFDYEQTCDRLNRFPEQLALFKDVCKKASLC